MSGKENLILKRISFLDAKNTIKKMNYFKLVSFENDDSLCVKNIEEITKEFMKIDSIPAYQKNKDDSKKNGLCWIEKSLRDLINDKEWLILVPNCKIPVWANVEIIDFKKAIEQVWDVSESGDFTIVDKTNNVIVQLYDEEYTYEIHIRKFF